MIVRRKKKLGIVAPLADCEGSVCLQAPFQVSASDDAKPCPKALCPKAVCNLEFREAACEPPADCGALAAEDAAAECNGIGSSTVR